ncbi:MAG: hypothetical protein JJE29_04095 [Peptostreptococcaceae bacterium]|nr:hypothetical protein [Peptostreptococcaceae bacterium]
MQILNDIYYTNREVLKKTIKAITANWKIFLVGMAYFIFSLLIWQIAARAWILSGLIIAVFQSAVISDFLYLMEQIIKKGKFTMNDFKEGFKVYIWKAYSVLILFWFVRYGLSLFLGRVLSASIGGISLWFVIEIVIFMALNPLPEVMYQKYNQGFDMISGAFDFIKENWIEWFVPNVLIAIVLYWMFGLAMKPFSAVSGIFISGAGTVMLIAVLITLPLVFSFFMIYRGFLFRILDRSTRRKRLYQYKIGHEE